MDLSKHQQSLGRCCQSFRSSQTCSITVSFYVERSASQTVQAAPLEDLQHPNPVLPQGGPAAHRSLCSNAEALGRSGDAGWPAAALTDCEQAQRQFEVTLSKKPPISSSLGYFLLQDIQLPECRLLVALRYQEGLGGQLAADIWKIAEASAILQQKGVELCVQLKPSSAESALPPPYVLAQMAPVLQRVKCSKLKTARRQIEDYHRAHDFSAAHISALPNAGISLQELCISDYNFGYWDDIMPDAFMASLATFSCLTRLDLICYGSPALQTLGQLSRLRKLALCVRHESLARETCCEAVLLSNNAGLKQVHLDGDAWSKTTYLALLTLTCLKVLTLTVSTISSPSAHVLGNVVATRCISIWFQRSYNIADCALQGLTSSCANITSLRLDFMSVRKCQHICTMEHLSSLTIFRPNHNSFTGFELVTQPNLSQLDLVCCRLLGTDGLRHIVHVFPNLTSIGIITESDLQAPWPKACIDSFVDICQLRKLELLDLSGLAHITAHQAAALEHAIRAQQKLGLLQPIVNLCLPKRPTDNGTCIHLLIDSSHQQVFSRTEPGEQLGVFVERYWRQKRVKAGAKLMLRCYMTARLVRAAFRFVARTLRVM